VFIDQVKIYVKAGDGGDGCVSFRREKYVPRGGPNGGDGGDGGSVVLRASGQLSTLVDLGYQQHYRVRRAEHGQGKDCHGKNSPDMVIAVPVGTVVRDAITEEVLADLTREGETVEVARGGKGGRGNARFATPTHRAPREAEPGRPGEERWLILELKLLADVGLVGLPNAGKSTLISRISAARPKTADYPFTTLTPHLGAVSYDDRSFVVADIPGLIEGAHLGKGLGTRFLRHIERTSYLLFMVDIAQDAPEDPVRTLEILIEEVSSYGHNLKGKPFSVLAAKTDVKGNANNLSGLEDHCRRKGYDLHRASSVTGEGIRDLVYFLGEKVSELKRSTEAHV
jgi:GTP-binding protein